MDRLKLVFITTVICAAVFGCQKGEEAAEDDGGLTASEITQALGMNWWDVQLPADLGPDDFVGVTYKQPDGSVDSNGGSSGWQAGTTVRVVVWEGADGTQLRYAILDETGQRRLRGSLPRESTMTGSTPLSEGTLVNAGDVLMKFYESSVAASPDVRPGELGLVLNVTRSE